MVYRLDESIRWCVHKADLALKNSAQKVLSHYDLTTEQWGVLSRLIEEDGYNQRSLADKNLKDQAALTRILDLLEKKGLVRRTRSEQDRREFLIFITDKGRELYDAVLPDLLNNTEKVTAGLTFDELVELKKMLTRLTEGIK
ncbi:MarR family transcriptional regulator [bacterium BFN5]|nr:MarR family transcriptional regulator [bacterium BFN5]QJW46038.1 MarR family transcriptional regulator [bacterium BFN5]